VGSADYYDEEIDGKVDMVRALRQPGSTIKPFIYALGIEKLGLTLDTPIFDLPVTLGAQKPNNSDGQFMGLLPLKQTLAYSRNIGPIKTFMAVGGEALVKPFLKAIGLRSLQDGVSYGYPLSIGAGEIQQLELANAYMHLSAAGQPSTINPILEIRTTN
jgi:penicillin-binding protein 1C